MENWKELLEKTTVVDHGQAAHCLGNQKLAGLRHTAAQHASNLQYDLFPMTKTTPSSRRSNGTNGRVLLPKMKTRTQFIEAKLLTNATRIYASERKPLRRKNLITNTIGSRILNDILALERRQTHGAMRLQYWWRSCLWKRRMQAEVDVFRAATQIQRYIKGFHDQKRRVQLQKKREHEARRIQSAFRAFYVRSIVYPHAVQLRQRSAVRIQNLFKNCISRRDAQRKIQFLAISHIQSSWRRHARRKRSIMSARNVSAIQIQRYWRGSVSRKRSKQHVQALGAIVQIMQSHYRGMRSRIRVFKLLWDRESEYREEWVSVLAAEEAWYQEKGSQLRAQLQDSGITERLSALEEEMYLLRQRIYDMEAAYKESKVQLRCVSPKEMEAGRIEALESNMKVLRCEITAKKFVAFFDVGYSLAQCEAQYDQWTSDIAKAEALRNQFSIWRETEYLHNQERISAWLETEEMLERRKRIADQKRRWAIPSYLKLSRKGQSCFSSGTKCSTKQGTNESMSLTNQRMQRIHNATNLRQQLQISLIFNRLLAIYDHKM